MQDIFKTKAIKRIIDANINRAKEGLRVCEEITRFIFNNRKLTQELKKIRHKIDDMIKRFPSHWSDFIISRDISEDIGKDIHAGELKRKDSKDIFFANMQRVKESIRVLEEFTKIIDKTQALGFKKIRYDIYELEKKAIKQIPALRYH